MLPKKLGHFSILITNLVIFCRSNWRDLIFLILKYYLVLEVLKKSFQRLRGKPACFQKYLLQEPFETIDKYNLMERLYMLDSSFIYTLSVLQIIAVVLILFNRTIIIGSIALLLLLNLQFLLALSYTTQMFGAILTLKYSFLIIINLIVLFKHRKRIIEVFKSLTQNKHIEFRPQLLVLIIIIVLAWQLRFVVNWFIIRLDNFIF